ncbi:MAG TPA: phosphatidylserine/phosphatidylglycerophosphate/cardiolipin synthase family protein [Nitrososphaera sp.]|nr:phosphatidylserine/phosphatidylglycerophosphate/cardiolipin synthase family protein [Nitrososphaera sp.]
MSKRQSIASHISQGGLRSRFGEQTFGNNVVFTVDGQETFRQIYEKIHLARTSIYIANYDLDPALRFVRNSELNEQASRHQHETYLLQDLLVEKAKEGIEVKIIVWEPRLVLRLLPGADERGIDGRADEVNIINEIAERHGISKNLMVRIDSSAPSLTSAHHEKIIIVDNQIGFCGGLDLSSGKWDTSSHDYYNPLRDPNSEPWHDVHAMVRGPVVWDLVYHFHQRWSYSQSRNARNVRKLTIRSNYPVSGSEGDVQAVALRTWNELDGNGGIQAWYAAMFRKARKSIYIENQFPFQNSLATTLLEKRLKEVDQLKVIIVCPMKPNLPGFIGSMIAKMSVNDVKDNLAMLRRAGDGKRVRTYSLVSQHPKIATKRRQIYVHSKVMIVDDKWITIGSANIDKNGFKDSSEFNLGITSPRLASELRTKLWKEHLQDAALDAGFEHGFYAWERTANENGQRVSEGRTMRGHAYYYNFEEMGMPPPYADAKGSASFELL